MYWGLIKAIKTKWNSNVPGPLGMGPAITINKIGNFYNSIGEYGEQRG